MGIRSNARARASARLSPDTLIQGDAKERETAETTRERERERKRERDQDTLSRIETHVSMLSSRAQVKAHDVVSGFEEFP